MDDEVLKAGIQLTNRMAEADLLIQRLTGSINTLHVLCEDGPMKECLGDLEQLIKSYLAQTYG